jgi:O-glycosyl hydrolase
VVRHYSRYIPAGSVRVDATPAYGEVLASAYVSKGGKGLTLVLTNPGAKPQEVSVTLKGLGSVKKLSTVRTSATEDSKPQGAAQVQGGKLRVTLPAQSLVTLTTVA